MQNTNPNIRIWNNDTQNAEMEKAELQYHKMQNADFLQHVSLPPDAETRILLENDLRNTWHFHCEAAFRWELTVIWSTVDSYRIVLDNEMGYSQEKAIRDMYNKPTAFYWEQSAQDGCITPRIIIAAIYEAWKGSFEYGHFLANPVRITSRGPKNLREIVQAHKRLCALAEASPYAPDNRHYRLQSLYPAVIIVCDRHEYRNAEEEDSDGLFSLKKVAQKQSVLVVCTGTVCSTPVSFDSIKQHALPLERPDVDGLDAIRVPLAVAVDFILLLEKQSQPTQDKYDYHPALRVHDCPEAFDRIVCNNPETWVHAMLAAAEKDGYGSMMHDMRKAVMRIEGRLAGRKSTWEFELELEEWSRNWKP